MTEHDPFERDLGRMLAPAPAPDALRRTIAGIPGAYPRRAASPWRSWFDGATMPWAASMMAGFASLAIGFWLGATGLTGVSEASADDELAALAFPASAMMGDEP